MLSNSIESDVFITTLKDEFRKLSGGGCDMVGKGPGNIIRGYPSEMQLAPPADGTGLVHVLVLFIPQNSPLDAQFPHSDQPPSVVGWGLVPYTDLIA